MKEEATLTKSAIDRQNVLNNTVALPRIQEALGVLALEFHGRFVLTKQMVADFYEVDIRTISRYIVKHKEELEHNGFFVCKGKDLKEFKSRYVKDINVLNKTPQIGLFDFRSFLNVGLCCSLSGCLPSRVAVNSLRNGHPSRRRSQLSSHSLHSSSNNLYGQFRGGHQEIILNTTPNMCLETENLCLDSTNLVYSTK